MSSASPFILRVVSGRRGSVRPFRTAAEAYDEAAFVRRTNLGLGSRLQVEDVQSGAILGQWRHDGTTWALEDQAATTTEAGHDVG